MDQPQSHIPEAAVRESLAENEYTAMRNKRILVACRFVRSNVVLLSLLLTSSSVKPLTLLGTIEPLQRYSNPQYAILCKATKFSSTSSSSFVSRSSEIEILGEDDDEVVLKSSATNKRSFLEMGRGDGKNKRIKKRKNKSSDASSSSSNNPAPLRVSNNLNIPVRTQIAWAKRNKEYVRQSTPGYRKPKVVRTKFRMTYDDDELELKRKERARRGREPDWDEILNPEARRTVLLVDGYNVLFQMDRLKRLLVNDDAHEARRRLVGELKSVSSINGWKIEVVFDGHKRSLIGPAGQATNEAPKPTREDLATTRYKEKDGVSVVYTGVGKEADSYIMARCFMAQQQNITNGQVSGNAGSFIVASNDNIVRMAAVGAGAVCMSSDRLIAEMEAARKFYLYQHQRFEETQPEFDSDIVLKLKINGTLTELAYGSLQGKQLVTDENNITYIEKAPPGQNDPLKYFKR